MANNTFFSFGYNVPDLITFQHTSLVINGVDQNVLGELIDEFDLTSHWTSSLPINVSMGFQIDLLRIREAMGLSLQDKIRLQLHSYSSGTKLQHVGSSSIAIEGNNHATLSVPAGEAAETLKLNATLVVELSPTGSRRIGAPVLNLSRIFTRTWNLKLSGAQSQANVVAVDFSNRSRWKKSLWRIQVKRLPDLDSWLLAQQSNVLRIEINKIYIELFVDPLFQVLLMTDIAVQALDEALQNDEISEFLSSNRDADGTWSIFVKSIFQSLFPEGGHLVKQKWKDNQEDLRTSIQSIVASGLELK